MADQLFVLVGAGASQDSVPFPDDGLSTLWEPPLVKDIFSDRFRGVLDNYPLVKQVSADVWARLAEPGDSALQLEDYLREVLYRSQIPERRAMYWSVPLYLQELLFECGRVYMTYADNYRLLVNALLEVGRVTYISLNYDTLLDRVIGNFRPIDDTLPSYTSYDIGLFKLHGSVNWGRAVDVQGIDGPFTHGFRPLCHELAQNEHRLSGQITLMQPSADQASLDETRYRDDLFYFPALAAPLGPDDQAVCPPEHRGALSMRLSQQGQGYGLHVLIIGYSCLDQTPLKMIEESGNVIKSLVIVNGDRARGETALALLRERLKAVAPHEYRGDYVEVFDGGFSDFATPPHLANLVQRVSAA